MGIKEDINPILGRTEAVDVITKIKRSSEELSSSLRCNAERKTRIIRTNMAAGVQYSKQKVAFNPLIIRYGSNIAINAENIIPIIKALFLIIDFLLI